MVYKHAGELLADSLADERGGNRGINAARKTENYALVAYLSANLLNGGVDEAVHLPLALTLANVVQERSEHVLAVLGMVYLGMELNAV